ncbi:ribonuclease P protein component [Neorickettsia helminthoeca]|uniref:ribonuclease P protein component n=1 Tax=Neorickettsia helminthoeca TaxID=33994 RepID=UPI000685DCF6|nr:ribonuclease P protein component [Neorickettsia helminthoeca]
MRLKGLKILSGRAFIHYQRNSSSYRSGAILLLVSRGTVPGPTVGFIVTRKVGSAVRRNKVRRKLRAVVVSLCSLGQLGNRSYILVPTPSAVFSDFTMIRDDVLNCLRKASL